MSLAHLSGVRAAFDAALADMRRCEGLLEGPLTADKKRLLETRLNDAGRALALSVEALAYVATEPPFIPPPRDPVLPANVVSIHAGSRA